MNGLNQLLRGKFILEQVMESLVWNLAGAT